MNQGNKLMICIFAAVILAMGLTGCTTAMPKDSGKISIVTTIFPEYDWVKEILGKNAQRAEVTMLLDNGIDLHSFQPSVEDIAKISNCDLFIYVGGESDRWVTDALKFATNEDRKVINLLEVLGDTVKEEEIVEGMEAEKGGEGETKKAGEEEFEETGEGKAEQVDEAKEGEEKPEYDEHVWLSLRNTQIFCDTIADALSEVDPEHASDYQANVTVYRKKLADLNERYQECVDGAARKTVLFGDRFPFRYMVDDYGLTYYAAFAGCSAETEASFETIIFLAKKTDDLELPYVLTTEKSDCTIAETVIENTTTKNQQVLSLNAMQSVTSKDVADGVTYYSLMEDNLKVLSEALH